jgi:hypothetical protein
VSEKMKVSKKTSVEVEKEFAEAPLHQKGKWTALMEDVKKTGKSVEVTELTQGSIAGAARRVKQLGLRCRTFYKEGRILILPADKPAKQ